MVNCNPVRNPSCRPPGCSVAGVTGPSRLPSWRDLELGAAEIGRLGTARLNSPRVALLGTLRRDSSPRISPVEPCIAEGRLLIGAMAWSMKTADLRRDPRYVLHSAVTEPDSGEGELKLSGAAVEVSQDHRSGVADAWWSAWPPGKAVVFSLGIEQAVLVEWDTEHGLMMVHRWSPQDGYTQSSRHYP
jgi:Pyridoxamine 5'-phosphate oxidase